MRGRDGGEEEEEADGPCFDTDIEDVGVHGSRGGFLSRRSVVLRGCRGYWSVLPVLKLHDRNIYIMML